MIIALFAGPGGACAGIEAATGLKPVGIEYEPNAVATRDAAGHVTIPADLTDLSPCLVDTDVTGLWGSPPCPAFSAAGKREGHDDLEELCWTAGRPTFWDMLAGDRYRKRWSHPDSHLIAQTFRWIGHHRPTWVALEQVPDVLPVWQALSHGLEQFGYSSWAGVLNAADYGVPQTRRRAFFMARLDGNVRPPAPTHAKQPEPVLFGDELAPWVTMADALGWSGDVVSGQTVAGGPLARRDTNEPAFTVTSRADLWTLDTHRDQRPDGTTQQVTTYRPAPTVTASSGGQWTLEYNRGEGMSERHGERPGRGVDEPAPTITGHGKDMSWQLRAGGPTGRPPRVRQADEPAPTVQLGHDASNWVWQRPATTVQGDARIAPPGHRDRAGGEPQFREGTVKCTPTELGVLQGFPADYPWQGSKTAQFQQIGNAVPPPMAEAIVRELIR